MTTDNNKGLFEKIKKTMTASQTIMVAGHSHPEIDCNIAEHKGEFDKHFQAFAEFAKQDLQQKEQLLQQQYALEHKRLSEELESKYQKSSEEFIRQQEQILKQKFEAEKQKLQQMLKDKYERIARTALQRREQEILQQAQHEIAKAKAHETEIINSVKKQQQLTNTEWQLKLDQLQQELFQYKQRFKLDLETATSQARIEQEAATRQKYEALLQRERALMLQDFEKKQVQNVEQQSEVIKQHYEIEVQRKIELLKSEYDLELNRQLLAKEQQLSAKFQQDLEKNNELQLAKLDLEIDRAVASAIKETEQKLQADFVQQQQQFDAEIMALKADFAKQLDASNARHQAAIQEKNHILQQKEQLIHDNNLEHERKVADLEIQIDKIQAEFAHNRNQLQQQIEASIRSEYETQINYFKSEAYRSQEVSRLVAEQRQVICKELEAEQLVIIKHKQRDLEAEYTAKLENHKAKLQQQFETDLANMIAAKEQLITEEFAAKLAAKEEQILQDCNDKIQEARITVEYATKQQALAAEQLAKLQHNEANLRSELNQQHAVETKALLQKQQQILLEQFDQDLQNRLHEQAQRLHIEHQNQLQELQVKLQVAQNTQQLANEDIQKIVANAVMNRELELTARYNSEIADLRARLEADFAVLQQKALQEQEIALRAKFANSKAEPQEDDSSFSQQQIIAQLAHEKHNLEQQFERDKNYALEQLRQELTLAAEAKLQQAKIEWENERLNDLKNHEASFKEVMDAKVAAAVLQRESQVRHEFQLKLEQQRELDQIAIRNQIQDEAQEQMQRTLEQYKVQLLTQLEQKQVIELETAKDELAEQYAKKLQQHLEIVKAEQEQMRTTMELEFNSRLQDAMLQQKQELQQTYQEQISQLETKKQEAIAIRIEQERKKLALKYAQDKATLIQELSAKFNQEKNHEMAEFENHLRDSLYKEMLKQKEYLQTKFNNAQELALQEQRRRLEAEHRHEIEKVKQGYFVRQSSSDFTQTVVNTRNRSRHVDKSVESLAEKILAKFQGHDKE